LTFFIDEFYPQEFARAVRQAGFQQVKLYGQGFSFPPTFYLAGKFPLLNQYFAPAAWLPPQLCNNSLVVAVK
jgi:hypothetical protein